MTLNNSPTPAPTLTLSAGDRVRVTIPGSPFDGITGTVVRRDPFEPSWWACRLDSWPEHELRIYPAGTRRENWLYVEPGAGEVEVVGKTTGGGQIPKPDPDVHRLQKRRGLVRLLRDLFRKGA